MQYITSSLKNITAYNITDLRRAEETWANEVYYERANKAEQAKNWLHKGTWVFNSNVILVLKGFFQAMWNIIKKSFEYLGTEDSILFVFLEAKDETEVELKWLQLNKKTMRRNKEKLSFTVSIPTALMV